MFCFYMILYQYLYIYSYIGMSYREYPQTALLNSEGQS